MIIVATELHLKSFFKFFPFIRHSIRSLSQAKQSNGCLHAAVTGKGFRIGYTLTAWDNKENLQHFKNTGAHKKAMKDIGRLSSRYKTLIWEGDTIPNWQQAKQLLGEVDFKEIRG